MFIDLHTHALFGIDDGAVDMDTSFNMLEYAFLQGVEVVVLTPHCVLRDEESIEIFINKRQQQFDILLKESKLQNKNIPQLLLGAEVYLDNDISKFDGIEQLCISGTKIILLELPVGKISRRMVDWIYNLTLLGLQPLLAHIERYHISKEIYTDLIDLGIEFQINASIFNTLKKRRILKKILKVTNRLCVSSDMHNTDSRCCNLKKSYIVANKKFPQIADRLFKHNPKELLNNFLKA